MTSVEKKLKESEEKFKTFFKGGLIPTYAWQKVDDDFILIDYNDVAEKITKGAVKKFLGFKASEMYKDRPQFLEELRRVAEEKTNIIHEIKYKMETTKEEKYLLVKSVFLPPDLVLIHTEDITNKKNAEEKLKESEVIFRDLYEEAPNAYFSIGTDKSIIRSNKAAERLLGYTKDEFLKMKVFDLYSDTEYGLERAKKVFRQFLDGEIIKDVELQMKNKDGDPIWVSLWVKPIFDPEGNVIESRSMILDINKRKKAEEKLKESENKFRTIFEAIPDLYFLVSEDTTILEYRGKKQELFVSPEEFMGKKVVEFMSSYLGNQIRELVKKTIETKQPQILEYQLPIRDEIHFFESRYFYLSKNQVSIFIRDITERKKIEKKINNLAKFPSENPNPVMRVNRDKVIYFNKASQNLFNFIKDDPIPKVFQEIIIEIINENILKNIEVEIGDKIYSFSITPIQEEGYANIYGRDITERKKSEVALKIEKEFTEDILNSSLDTIFVFEPETGKAIRWNKAFNEVSGYTDKEIFSMRAPDSYYSEEDLRKAVEASKKVVKKGKVTVEMSLITKEGRSIPFEYRGTTIKGSEGELLIVSLGRDISERKSAEQKLKESEMKYREAYDKANFYRDLFTHDMNNILQIINSSAELIDFQLGDSEQSKYIGNMANMIKNQVERGSKLISNVRTFSELEEEEITTNQIEITGFLRNSIDFVKKSYSERQISIFAGKLDEIYFINGNDLLQEVFDNILINSIKYNENANVEILIKISKQNSDNKDFIKIEFIDNGIGVADDRKEVIFKEGNRELKGSKGMGLGLSLVKKILKSFKGKIWVEDKVKGDYTKGSNFVILLPELN